MYQKRHQLTYLYVHKFKNHPSGNIHKPRSRLIFHSWMNASDKVVRKKITAFKTENISYNVDVIVTLKLPKRSTRLIKSLQRPPLVT